jgi:hypothetical protein
MGKTTGKRIDKKNIMEYNGTMKTKHITICGYEVLIDNEDFDLVMSKKWRPYKKDIPKGRIYFICGQYNGKNNDTIRLHRLIMGCKKNDGAVVDHINGNTLDNRKKNLRICTIGQNATNQAKRRSNTSGYKGVTWHKQDKLWQAQIMVNYKHIFLGLYEDPKEAYNAYCEASKKYHGEFSRLS